MLPHGQGGATGHVLVMEDWPECLCMSSYRMVVVLLVLLVMSCGDESIRELHQM